MPRRSMFFFLILVFLVAMGGTFLAIQLFAGNDSSSPQIITVQVQITTTPVPMTPQVMIVTATFEPGQRTLPDGIVPDALSASGAGTASGPAPTLDPTLVGANAVVGLTATSLPPNCILHAIEDGDTPFGVADEYGADPFQLMTINGLDDESATLLRIGDILIVPLAGCEIEPPSGEAPTETPTLTPEDVEETDEPDASPTPSHTPTITPTPTITLPPTSTSAQIEILEINSPGDITLESVKILNTGQSVDITGWTLADLDGNVYTFQEQQLFSNSDLTINTRAGENTPVVLYWGLDRAVWGEPGDILTLRDSDGRVQASLRVPEN